MHIVVIEDDPDLLDSLCLLLNAEGFTADGVRSIAAFKMWQATHHYDLAILDRTLPDGEGLDLVPHIKTNSDIPVIVLTGLGDTQNRAEGFNADVDYYISKPMTSEELLAVVKRCQRRLNTNMLSAWQLSKVSWILSNQNGAKIKLTNNEFLFISAFIGKAGTVVSRSDLAKALGQDPDIYDYRRMEVLIKRLRQKINQHTDNCPLQSIYGAGYAFNEILQWENPNS